MSTDENVSATGRPEDNEPTKRLVIDLPATLHLKVKLGCLRDGTTMSEVVRQQLVELYGDIITDI